MAVPKNPARIKAGSIEQVSIVVKNLEKTMADYWRYLGIGPWQVHDMRSPKMWGLTYRGKPGEFMMKVAFTMVGKVELELIEPVSGDNIYRDFLVERGEGLHHLLFVAGDVDKVTKAMREDGFALVQSGHLADGHWAYYETTEKLAAIWEVARRPSSLSPDYRYPGAGEMSPARIKAGSIEQVSIVVKNLEQTMANYWRYLGIGPWEVHDMRSPKMWGLTYRGKPGEFTMKVAFTMVGKVELELIEPVSGDNIYRDFLVERGEGLHHLLFVAEDVDKVTKVMVGEGFALVQSGHLADGHWAYYDTTEKLAAIWEVARRPSSLSPERRYPGLED